MKGKSVLVASAIGAAILASPSVLLAQDTPFYIGGFVGQAKNNGICSVLINAGATRCDDSATAWKGLAGYQLNRNFSAEGGYGQIGKVNVTGPGGNAEITGRAWEAVGIGAYPVSDVFSIFGKLGYFKARFKLNTVGITTKESTSDFTWGFGGRYDFSKQFAMRAEYQHYEGLDANVYGITAIFKF